MIRMVYLLAPFLLSYLTFVFVAEQLNPLKTAREVSVRRRARLGRKIALIVLPISLLLGFTMRYFSG